jgi:hypothetical protein
MKSVALIELEGHVHLCSSLGVHGVIKYEKPCFRVIRKYWFAIIGKEGGNMFN